MNRRSLLIGLLSSVAPMPMPAAAAAFGAPTSGPLTADHVRAVVDIMKARNVPPLMVDGRLVYAMVARQQLPFSSGQNFTQWVDA